MRGTAIVVSLFCVAVCVPLSAGEHIQPNETPNPGAPRPASIEILPHGSVACPECIEWIGHHDQLIRKEFTKAIDHYPALSYSWAVLAQEYGYAQEFGNFSGRIQYTPRPDGELENKIPLPEELWEWFYEERRENFEKMKNALDDLEVEEEPKEIDHRWTYCQRLKNQHAAASACVEGYLADDPDTDEEWQEFNECLETIQEYIDARDYCSAYW